MTGTLLKRLEQHIWWSSQKHVLPPRGALRKSMREKVRCVKENSADARDSYLH